MKVRTDAFVISTGSRAESQEWCRKVGVLVAYVGQHDDVHLKPVAGRVHLKIEDTRLHRFGSAATIGGHARDQLRGALSFPDVASANSLCYKRRLSFSARASDALCDRQREKLTDRWR